MKVVLSSAPASEPVTTAEIQTHAIVTGDDTYLDTLITTCRKSVERYLNRALITQTWIAYYDNWMSCFRLPYPPLVSVTSVKYYDSDGTLQTLSTNQYWVSNTGDPGEVIRAYNVTYPELQDGRPDRIQITYVAGFGNAAAVPAEIKHAIKLWATDLYEHRGTVVIGSVNVIPNYIINLIHTYKIYEF